MRSPCRKGTENHHGKTANAKSHRVQEEFIGGKRDKCKSFHSNIYVGNSILINTIMTP
jgi:hypothetical protein